MVKIKYKLLIIAFLGIIFFGFQNFYAGAVDRWGVLPTNLDWASNLSNSQAINAKYMRLPIGWAEYTSQTDRGHLDTSMAGALDAIVNQAASRGIEMVFLIKPNYKSSGVTVFTPQDQSLLTPETDNEGTSYPLPTYNDSSGVTSALPTSDVYGQWLSFVADISERYNGQVNLYETVAEGDTLKYWYGRSDEYFNQLLPDFKTAVQSRNPQAKIMAASLFSDNIGSYIIGQYDESHSDAETLIYGNQFFQYLKSFTNYSTGLRAWLDSIGALYSPLGHDGANAFGPVTSAKRSRKLFMDKGIFDSTHFSKFDIVSLHNYHSHTHMKDFIDLIKNRIPGKEIVITEFGLQAQTSVTDTAAAIDFTKKAVIAKYKGVSSIFYSGLNAFTYFGFYAPGLYDINWNLLPAGKSFKLLAGLFIDYAPDHEDLQLGQYDVFYFKKASEAGAYLVSGWLDDSLTQGMNVSVSVPQGAKSYDLYNYTGDNKTTYFIPGGATSIQVTVLPQEPFLIQFSTVGDTTPPSAPQGLMVE